MKLFIFALLSLTGAFAGAQVSDDVLEEYARASAADARRIDQQLVRAGAKAQLAGSSIAAAERTARAQSALADHNAEMRRVCGFSLVSSICNSAYSYMNSPEPLQNELRQAQRDQALAEEALEGPRGEVERLIRPPEAGDRNSQARPANGTGRLTDAQIASFFRTQGLVGRFNMLQGQIGNQRAALNFLESKLNLSNIGAYMGNQFAKLLNSDLYCQAKARCEGKNGGRSVSYDSVMASLFSNRTATPAQEAPARVRQGTR